MKNFLYHRLVSFFLWYQEREMLKLPKEVLTPEQETGLLSMLWSNQAFRNYISDRNAKLIYYMAGAPGLEPEPREKLLIKYGQRIEILELGAKAKAAAARVEQAKTKQKQK